VGELRNRLRTSAVPYLCVAAAAVLIGRFFTYLVRGDVTVKGQPLVIVVTYVGFAIAGILWLLYRGERTRSPLLATFLCGMALVWLLHMVLMYVHDDAYNYMAFLFPVFMLLLLLKTPSADEAWTGLVAFAWVLAAILLGSWVLEISGLMEPLPLPESITAFQQDQYWLPLDGFMGVDGRWTGPFGHNTRAGLGAAFVLIIAVSRWRWSSIPLALIGAFMLLITAVRASMLSVFAALVVLVIFSRRGLLAKVPMWARFSALGVAVVGGAVFLLGAKAGLTGRQSIWPAFVDMFPQSPWTGIGASGIAQGPHIVVISGDAHNIFLDELVRNGVLGFVTQFAVIGLGIFIAFLAAARGFAPAAAILAAYLIAAQTDVQNDWIHLSYLLFVVVVTVVAAGSWLRENDPDRQQVPA
jgi:hypothetical protein